MNISIIRLYSLLTEKVGKEDVANVKTDMIKWFVGLFVAMTLMIIGLYFKK